MRHEIALALAADMERREAAADRANQRREVEREENEMEAIYRAQDAAHEARYGRYDDDGYDD